MIRLPADSRLPFSQAYAARRLTSWFAKSERGAVKRGGGRYARPRPKLSPAESWLPFETAQSVEDLETHGYRAREDLPPWPFSLPIAWRANPFADDNWQFLFHGWGMTGPYFARYRATGDVAALASAAEIGADWARFHYEEQGEADYSWFDMSAGFRAVRTAFLLDRIDCGELILSHPVEKRLRRLAEDHFHRLHAEGDVAINNHGLFQMLGLRMLTPFMPKATRGDAKAFARRMVNTIVRHSYASSGVHREHSPAYALHVTAWLGQPAFARWWPELASRRIARAKALGPWYVLPNGEVAAVGDNFGRPAPGALLSAESTRLGDGRSFAVKDLTADGYAIVRSLPTVAPGASSMLFVTGAAHSLTHKHVDDLSFILFEAGRLVFVDTGMVDYTRDARRRYVLGASAHNTICLADVHIEPKNVTIGGSTLAPIEIAGSAFVVRGIVQRGTLFRQERTMTYDPGRSLTIRDELSGRYERQYISSLHLAPDLEPTVEGRGFTADLGGGLVLAACVGETDGVVTVARGQEDPLLGWVAQDGRLVPTCVVRAHCPGKNRSITWRITFQRSAEDRQPDAVTPPGTAAPGRNRRGA